MFLFLVVFVLMMLIPSPRWLLSRGKSSFVTVDAFRAVCFTPPIGRSFRRHLRTISRPSPTRIPRSRVDDRFGVAVSGAGSPFAAEVDPGNVKGTKLRILKYPHPQLRAENAKIELFDDNLKQLASEMLLVMYAADGIGLAAPQVGINKRLMVFNEAGSPSVPEKEMILANPVVITRSEETNLREEGCLSFPLISGHVERHVWIEVEYNNLAGETARVKLQGMPARIFQHEYDHLDKVLFIDRLVPADKAQNQKRLDKYVKKYGPGGAP